MAKTKTQAAHKELGSSSGLGITAYFVVLFETNEILSKKDKMTDLTIAKKVAAEFPDRPTAQLEHFTGPNKKHTINSYRYRYNVGVFSRSIPPGRRSFRYNVKGEIVNDKTGVHRLFPPEISAMKEEHKAKRRKLIRKKMRK